MLRLLVVLLLINVLSCSKSNNSKTNLYPENLKVLHENVITYHANQPIDFANVENLLSDLKDDGSWSSIDYTNKIRGGWPVKLHLKYVQDLAMAYSNRASKLYQDKSLKKRIHLSLNYWLNNDFLSVNWHDQHIGVPELLLPTLFLIEKELTETQKEKAKILLDRADIKMSGQNKVWLSTNVMLRSLLFKKPDSVAIASKAIQEELKVTKGVGVKADWSYHEHGAQLQFGNYGLSYLEDMIKCYTLLHNTPFQFADNKIEILRNIVLKGQQWVIWNGKYDINASGRQLFVNEQTLKYERLKACLEKLKALDIENIEAYKEAINSKKKSGNKHFWKSDFHVYRKKDFYFSLKMSSKRVVGTECVNKENVQGYYMGDGVTMLSTNGNEYYNVLPFWDWKKLPGTTLIQDTAKLPMIKFSDFKTNGEFVGGVSCNKNGIATMDYNRDGLKAKKSWFMFDNKIVCLGSGIEASTNFYVNTTVNQAFLKNDVILGDNNNVTRGVRGKKSLKADWVLHDNIGYLFPNKNKVNIVAKIFEGSWNNVAKRYRPVILTNNIFKLWLNHGSNPKNETYVYVLVPNSSIDEMQSLSRKRSFNFVNTTKQQSVVSINGKIGGVVFYEAGYSNLFGGISVNKPCVILIEKKEDGLILSVSDPTQKQGAINVTIKGVFVGNHAKNSANETEITIPLPQDEFAGSTVKIELISEVL